MTFSAPESVQNGDIDRLRQILDRYYRKLPGYGYSFTGSQFDTWNGNGTAQKDPNQFTPDDLVAVTFLSVKVPPRAASLLLRDDRDRFNELLADVVDVDLHTLDIVPPEGWKVMEALQELPGIGPTIASKLLARKRPRLRPIYDSVVEKFLGPDQHQWEPIRAALRGDPDLVATLKRARSEANLPPDGVSVLRVLDVICWCEGKGN